VRRHEAGSWGGGAPPAHSIASYIEHVTGIRLRPRHDKRLPQRRPRGGDQAGLADRVQCVEVQHAHGVRHRVYDAVGRRRQDADKPARRYHPRTPAPARHASARGQQESRVQRRVASQRVGQRFRAHTESKAGSTPPNGGPVRAGNRGRGGAAGRIVLRGSAAASAHHTAAGTRTSRDSSQIRHQKREAPSTACSRWRLLGGSLGTQICCWGRGREGSSPAPTPQARSRHAQANAVHRKYDGLRQGWEGKGGGREGKERKGRGFIGAPRTSAMAGAWEQSSLTKYANTTALGTPTPVASTTRSRGCTARKLPTRLGVGPVPGCVSICTAAMDVDTVVMAINRVVTEAPVPA
jgi:hypothetical protein